MYTVADFLIALALIFYNASLVSVQSKFNYCTVLSTRFTSLFPTALESVFFL